MARLGFRFPQLPYSSLACPFSEVFVVGDIGILIYFLPAQVLPSQALRGVISLFPWVKGKLPLYPWGCLLRVRTNPNRFGAEACDSSASHTLPYVLGGCHGATSILSCARWTHQMHKATNSINPGLRKFTDRA
jgi:hypothetical protein